MHWFKQPEFMRPLRDCIEPFSDLIFTGHEHEPLAYEKDIYGADRYLYIEGGVLQERGSPRICSFNIIRLDFDRREQSFVTYSWNTRGFFEKASKPRLSQLAENRSRLDRHYPLDTSFETRLDEIELPIKHPRRDRIGLSEIFVYPDLRIFKDSSEEVLYRIKSERAFETITSHNRVLVTGAEKSGKTSLVRRLFIDIHRSGCVPLLLDAVQLKNTGDTDNLRKTLSKLVKEQYKFLAPEQHEQLPADSKVLIVDDLQELQVPHSARPGFFNYLEHHFGKVILVGSDEFCLEELYGAHKDSTALVGYKRFDICEFGFVLLEVLVRKWLSLSSGYPGDDFLPTDENVRRIVSLVEQVLRTNAIPHHPWVLIALLQSVDTARGPAAKNGSYGHLFEAIITFALDASRYKTIDIRGKYTILSEYGYTLFSRNCASLEDDEVAEFFRRYRAAYEIEFDDVRLRDDLVEIGLLRPR